MTSAFDPTSKFLPPLVLASGSPRRRALLEACGLQLTQQPSQADETWPTSLDLSLEAALLEVTHRKLAHLSDATPWALAADTIVALGSEVLGKPQDAAAARRMLARLSGTVHRVMTGFVLMVQSPDGQRRMHAQSVTTQVRFRVLSADDIARYVALGDSLDKAGAYGIQSQAGHLVDSVAGSYTNIIGLPVPEVLAAMQTLGPPPCRPS